MERHRNRIGITFKHPTEAQILKIFLLSRCSEDLPQLIVAATYLGPADARSGFSPA